MNRRRFALTISAISLVSLGSRREISANAFPAFVMFRGGNLDKPVLLVHSNMRWVRGVLYVDKDPLALLFQSLELSTISPDSGEVERSFEVAEFFGPSWTALVNPDGRPGRELRFQDANHFSKISVVGPSRRVIWSDPVIPSVSNSATGYVGKYSIGQRGVAILTGLGLQFGR